MGRFLIGFKEEDIGRGKRLCVGCRERKVLRRIYGCVVLFFEVNFWYNNEYCSR